MTQETLIEAEQTEQDRDGRRRMDPECLTTNRILALLDDHEPRARQRIGIFIMDRIGLLGGAQFAAQK